jgi:hypothetical protein
VAILQLALCMHFAVENSKWEYLEVKEREQQVLTLLKKDTSLH